MATYCLSHLLIRCWRWPQLPEQAHVLPSSRGSSGYILSLGIPNHRGKLRVPSGSCIRDEAGFDVVSLRTSGRDEAVPVSATELLFLWAARAYNSDPATHSADDLSSGRLFSPNAMRLCHGSAMSHCHGRTFLRMVLLFCTSPKRRPIHDVSSSIPALLVQTINRTRDTTSYVTTAADQTSTLKSYKAASSTSSALQNAKSSGAT